MRATKTVVGAMALCAVSAMTQGAQAQERESVVREAPAQPQLNPQRRELKPEALSGEMTERDRLMAQPTVVWPALAPTMPVEAKPQAAQADVEEKPTPGIAQTAPAPGSEMPPPKTEAAPAEVVRPVSTPVGRDTVEVVRPVSTPRGDESIAKVSAPAVSSRDGCGTDLPVERAPIPWQWTGESEEPGNASTSAHASRRTQTNSEYWCVQAGQTLYETLTRWGTRRMLRVEREGDDVPEWPLQFGALFEGSFIEAVEWLVGGVQQSFVERPLVRIHTNNVVVLSSKSERDRIR